jgi:TonB-linked SusC/RagA family outer membrane protein
MKKTILWTNSIRRCGIKLVMIISCTFIYLSLTCFHLLAESKLTNNIINSDLKLEMFQLKISGKVVDGSGTPLAGVNVLLKGTSTGTITDLDGNFNIEIEKGDATLIFSYLGYISQEVEVGTQTQINITLNEDVTALGEVVVTALGIEKSSKSLSYSAQQISNDEVSSVKDVSMINSLTGKVAGLSIQKSSAGAGGSTRILMRGAKSMSDADKVLIVIDGIPMPNYSSSTVGSVWGGRDGGDMISNINPDDIESLTVLKGASAAALYGSDAANGCILITTKKGKAGVTKVEFSSSYMADKPYSLPEFQTSYGQTSDGSTDSWGAKTTQPTVNVNDFYNTGSTLINSLSFTTGNDQFTSYVSYANTSSNGIMPTNKLNRHNINLRMNAKFSEKFSIDGNVNLISQKINNRPLSGFYFNPMVSLYTFPRGVDFNQYKNEFEVYDVSRNMNVQNWPFDDPILQNPYWILNRNANTDNRNRLISSISIKYDILPWMNLKIRGSVDRTEDVFEQKIFASTQATLAATTGRYILNDGTSTQLYADAILNYNKTFNNFNVAGVLGGSISDGQGKSYGFDSGSQGLFLANYFAVSSIMPGSYKGNGLYRSQLQSLFFNANISYKEMVYLELTGRNDWSTTLDPKYASYFYPSAGLSILLNEIFSLPEQVNLGKIRLSASQVGSSIPAYIINPTNGMNNLGQITLNTTKPFDELKPELTTSFEIGTQWQLYDNRLNFDFTYYKTNTINQLISAAAPAASGYSEYYLNAGNIQNTGFEIVLGFYPVRKKDFTWQASLNFTRNKNLVVEYTDYSDEDLLYDDSGFQTRIKEGGEFGDMYGKVLKKHEDGTIYVDNTGRPIIADEYGYLGNLNPDWKMGLNNNVQFKNIYMNILLDLSVGGQVVSMTQAMLDSYGVSKNSGDARDGGGVDRKAYIDGTTTPYSGKLDPQTYYTTVGGRGGVYGEYVYDATNFRVRELSIGYNLPKTMLSKLGIVKNLQLSFIARNLIVVKNAPFDPELIMSTSNSFQGIDVFTLPPTRNYGLSLKIEF